MSYLADRWSALFRKPSIVVRAFAENITTQAQIKEVLNLERSALDDLHKSKNNWNSIFISGLLDPPVTTWIAAKFARQGRVPDSELI